MEFDFFCDNNLTAVGVASVEQSCQSVLCKLEQQPRQRRELAHAPKIYLTDSHKQQQQRRQRQ
jgi:hypothetical protein